MAYQENMENRNVSNNYAENLIDGGRLRYGKVCSRADLIKEHIKKHQLDLTLLEYLTIADIARNESGIDQGTLLTNYNDRVYRILLNGKVELENETFSIVRSIVCLGKKREGSPYSQYELKIRVIGKNKHTYIKPNLPEWSLPNISDAIMRLDTSETKRGTYYYDQPIQHLIKIRKTATRVPKKPIIF